MNNAELTKRKKTPRASYPRNKKAKKSKQSYVSTLRDEQSQLTQIKIQNALFELFQNGAAIESITYKAVAKKASVTEMTVFRHFPERTVLLKSLWEKINQTLGRNVALPQNADDLLTKNRDLHLGFAEHPHICTASISSEQGREMRASINKERETAFQNIVRELNPKLDSQQGVRYAAILQLLNSAYAFESLRHQWNFSGTDIADVTSNTIQIIMNQIKKGTVI